MELSSSWETNSHPATQEIRSILWNLEVHYRVHKSSSLVPDERVAVLLFCSSIQRHWAYVTLVVGCYCSQDSPFAFIVIISDAEGFVAPSTIVASEGRVARADASPDVASGW
jgi:hypothetical protein